MASPEFSAVSILNNKVFSWVFLVDWIMALALVIFMIFFFNRLVGWVVSYGIKWYLWRCHNAHFEVQSVQLSLLGGRLFFKNITYIGTNEAICAVQGSITWRYWLLHYREAGILGSSCNKNTSFPSRLCLKVNGLEWFVFNRTAAYDELFEYLDKSSSERKHSTDSTKADNVKDTEKFFDFSHNSNNSEGSSTNNSLNATKKFGKPTNDLDFNEQSSKSESHDPLDTSSAHSGVSYKAINPEEEAGAPRGDKATSFLAKILPLEVQCSKAAMVLGNTNTPHHLIFHVRTSTIITDMQEASSQKDLYRLSVELDMVKPVIELRTNIDYNRPSMAGFPSLTPMSVLRRYKAKRRQSRHLKELNFLNWFDRQRKNRSKSKIPESGSDPKCGDIPTWRGLSRYQMFGDSEEFLEDAKIEKDMFVEEEYGKYSVLLDAPSGSVIYYYDQPGLVQQPPQNSGLRDSEPEWGVHMQFRDATIHYGPWADRQRVPLQQLLFPQYCVDTKIPDPGDLPSGQIRISTEFNLLVEFNGDTIIRVPIREFSQDAAFLQKKRNDPLATSARPFGWLEAKVRQGSTLSLAAQLVPSENGWKNVFTFDMKQLELRSSVNHGLFFQADSHLLHGDMCSSNKWNGLNNWQLRNSSDTAKMFLLREHVTLISDLFADFSAGPPTPYDMFVPFHYEVHWTIARYSIYLNVNDMNVINSPTDFDDNVFLSFQGRILDITANVPIDQVLATSNKTAFDIRTPQFDLIVDAPQWHTIKNFLPSNEVGRAYNFELKGTYQFYSDVDSSYTDRVCIDMSAKYVTLLCYGFVVKYVMKIRENYFGENIHFRTLEEYLEDPVVREPQYSHTRMDNDLDVLLHVYVTDGCVALPCNIYSGRSNVRLDFNSFDIDCRFTNYYMDIQVDVSPIKGKHNVSTESMILDFAKTGAPESSHLFVDGLSIRGNRLFGLPPTEPTYYCKWDFDIGTISMDAPLFIADQLAKVANCVGYSYEDAENSLLLDCPVIHDVTIVSINITGGLNVYLRATDTFTGISANCAAIELITGDIRLTFNDLANERYSSRFSVKVPFIRASVVRSSHVLLTIESSLSISNFGQKQAMDDAREKQQDHVMMHDAPFMRTPFFLDAKHRAAKRYVAGKMKGPFPSIPIPPIPAPLNKEALHIVDLAAVSTYNVSTGPDFMRSSISSSVECSAHSTKSKFSSTLGWSDQDSHNPSAGRNFPQTSTGAHQFEGHHEVYADFGKFNWFIPPYSWHKFEKVSTPEQLANQVRSLHPTIHYSSNFRLSPEEKPNPENEYDNVIVQFGTVNGHMKAQALAAFIEISDCAGKGESLESVMDTLQVDFFKRLHMRQLGKGKTAVLNAQISIPSIRFQVDCLFDKEFRESTSMYEQPPLLLIDLSEINTVVRSQVKHLSAYELQKVKTEKAAANPFSLEVHVAHTLYLNLETVNVGIQTQASEEPFALQVSNTEFWWDESDQSTASLRIKSIDSYVVRTQLQWLIDFVHDLIEFAEQHKRATTATKSQRTAYVLYHLALAGEMFNIRQDPAALTRPSYILQSPQHIRASASWKIMMRLRHLLRSVPVEWSEQHSVSVSENSVEVPKDVKEQTISVFSRWRNWELLNISASYLFGFVFRERSIKEHILSISTHALIDFESLILRVEDSTTEDFFLFDYLKVLVKWGKQARDSDIDRLVADCIISCATVRSEINLEPVKHMKTPMQPLAMISNSSVSTTVPSPAAHSVPSLHSQALSSTYDSSSDLYRTDSFATALESQPATSRTQSRLTFVVAEHNDADDRASRTDSSEAGVPEENLSSADLDADINLSKALNDSTPLSLPPFSLTCSVMIEDVRASVLIPGFELCLDSRGMNFSGFYEEVDSKKEGPVALTLIGRLADLDLTFWHTRAEKEKVFSVKWMDISTNLSCNGVLQRCSKHVQGQAAYVRMEIQKDVLFFAEQVVALRSTSWRFRGVDVHIPTRRRPELDPSKRPVSFAGDSKPSFSSQQRNRGFLSNYGPVYARLEATKLVFFVHMLPSLDLHYMCTNGTFKTQHTDAYTMVADVCVDAQTWELKLSDHLCGFKTSKLSVMGRYSSKNATRIFDFCDILISLELLELSSGTVEMIVKDSPTLESEIIAVRDYFKQVGHLLKNSNEIGGTGHTKTNTLVAPLSSATATNADPSRTSGHSLVDMMETFRVNFNISIASFAFVVPLFGSLAVLDLDKSTLKISSYGLDKTIDQPISTPWTSKITINEIRLALVRGIEEKRADIVKTKVVIEIAEHRPNHYLIDILSNFFRVELQIVVVHRLLEIKRLLQKAMKDRKEKFPSTIHGQPPQVSVPPTKRSARSSYEASPSPFVVETIEKFMLNMTIRDAELAWLFEDDEKGAPGMIIGYNQLEIILNPWEAQMALQNVFLIPAAENTIFWKERITPAIINTAILPSVKLYAKRTLEKNDKHGLGVAFLGDSLRMNYDARIAEIFGRFMRSLALTRALIESGDVKASAQTAPAEELCPIRLPFSWRLSVNFAKAVVILRSARLDDAFYSDKKLVEDSTSEVDDLGEDESDNGGSRTAVKLVTPALKTVFDYEATDGKVDFFNSEIIITPSTNVIYPTAVPVLLEFTEAAMANAKKSRSLSQKETSSSNSEDNDLIGTTQEPSPACASPKESDNSKPKSKNPILILLSAVDVAVAVRFKSQELSLSCLPTAKVAASVSIKEWALGLNISRGKNALISGYSSVEYFRASLQHIYSRKTSGFVELKRVTAVVSHLRAKNEDKPKLRIISEIDGIAFHLNMRQVQDMEVFIDVWRPSSKIEPIDMDDPFETEVKQVSMVEDKHGAFGAGDFESLKFVFIISVRDLRAKVDFGQTIGEVCLTLDNTWSCGFRDSEQLSTIFQLKSARMTSEGRLGGFVALDYLRLKFTKGVRNALAVSFNSLEAKASLDYHSFLMLWINRVHFGFCQQAPLDEHSKLSENRAWQLVAFDVTSIKVYSTVLVASNLYDIVSTFQKLRMASHASYMAILLDSSNDRKGPKTKLLMAKQERVRPNRAEMDVRIRRVEIHVFPNTFSDTNMFFGGLNETHISLKQKHTGTLIKRGRNMPGISVIPSRTSASGLVSVDCQLGITVSGLVVSLTTLKKGYMGNLETIGEGLITAQEFGDFVMKHVSKGGTIISIPTLNLVMNTWQQTKRHIVEYTFNSSFGGRVDIGWNLGSVNFIREMWETHNRAISLRKETWYMNKAQHKQYLAGSGLEDQVEKEGPEIDAIKPQWTYIAREPPVIATPQLKDMGEATPPVEWLGLHRQKLPALTFEYIIEPLRDINRIGVGDYFDQGDLRKTQS